MFCTSFCNANENDSRRNPPKIKSPSSSRKGGTSEGEAGVRKLPSLPVSFSAPLTYNSLLVLQKSFCI